jgi:hypothetical protein
MKKKLHMKFHTRFTGFLVCLLFGQSCLAQIASDCHNALFYAYSSKEKLLIINETAIMLTHRDNADRTLREAYDECWKTYARDYFKGPFYGHFHIDYNTNCLTKKGYRHPEKAHLLNEYRSKGFIIKELQSWENKEMDCESINAIVEKYKKIDQRIQENREDPILNPTATEVIYDHDLKNKKEYDKTSYVRFDFNVGLVNTPIIENATVSGRGNGSSYSSTGTAPYWSGQVGLEWWVYRNQLVGFMLKPSLTYGTTFDQNAFETRYTDFGGTARLSVGKGVKLYGEVGYEWRLGYWLYDLDNAIARTTGISVNTNTQIRSTFNYTVSQFGGGLIFDTGEVLPIVWTAKRGFYHEKLSGTRA